jgi:hypothetical protein
MENMKIKKNNGIKKFDLPQRRFEPRISEDNLNFEGD